MFAALLVFAYGQRGYLPLDSSIVFQGGIALHCGAVPYGDLAAPAGLPLFLGQHLVSSLLGVTWLAYLAHAAVLNATGALVCWAILRQRGCSRAVALSAASATALVFLPPIGTPYPDHGSFLFSGLALSAALAAAKDRRRSRLALLLWAGAGGMWCLAFLAKPIPAAFFLLLLVAAQVAMPREAGSRRRAIAGFAAGSATTLLLTLSLADAALQDYLVEGVVKLLPVGGGRLALSLADSGAHVRAVVAPAWAVPLALWLLVGGLATWSTRWGSAPVAAEVSAARRDRLLSAGLVVASLLYACLTFRSGWTSLGWLPLALGLAWAPADRGFAVASGRGPEAPNPRAARRTRSAGAIAGLACVAWLGSFHVVVNERRGALMMDLRGRLAAQAVPPGLEWLDPETPAFTATDGESLRAVVAFLRDRPESFFLLGDSSLIYGLAGRCSPSPVLWFHPYLTVPWRGETATVEFQQVLIARLERERVRYLVVENGGTQMGVTPDTLPLVRDWAAARIRAMHRFGSFEVFDLGAALVDSWSESPGG